MTLQQAMQRLFWRMGNGRFEPNSNDIESVKFIAEWINREKEQRMATNHHFGKIVSWCFLNLLGYYSGDRQLAEMQIIKIFETPLSEHYERIRLEMDAFKDREAFDLLDIKDAYQVDKREDGFRYLSDVRAKHKENNAIISENIDILLEAIKPLEYKYVSNNMQIFITELLNKYADKK